MMKNLSVKNRFKALALAGIMMVTTPMLASCNGKNQDNEETSYSVDFTYNEFNDLLASLPDGIKKENLQKIYSVLYNLNGEVANSVKVSEDGSKLFQMDWDTIVALSLASNDYTSTEMLDMFDECTYKEDYLYERYKNFCSIFIPFGERLTTSTGLDELINDSTQKGDFLKYENILIEINKARKDNKESELNNLYKTAFAYIRGDFLSSTGGSAFANPTDDKEKVIGYYALTIPYVNTIIELGRNSDYKLTDDEIKILNSDGVCNSALTSIEDNIEGLNMKLCSIDSIELAGAYAEGRNLATKELIENNLYFISWEQSTLPLLNNMELLYNEINTTSEYSNYSIGSSSYSKNTVTRSYNDINDLKKNENDNVIKQAESGKKKVDEQIEEENERNKQEAIKDANEKASQESKENKDANDQKMDEIRDNSQVIDKNGNVSEDKNIVQPDNKNEAIGEVIIDRDYDGDAYDKDGNKIVTGCIKVLSLHL